MGDLDLTLLIAFLRIKQKLHTGRERRSRWRGGGCTHRASARCSFSPSATYHPTRGWYPGGGAM